MGDNFAPGGQSILLGAKLRMGLSFKNSTLGAKCDPGVEDGRQV
jgi:hypothetical protein